MQRLPWRFCPVIYMVLRTYTVAWTIADKPKSVADAGPYTHASGMINEDVEIPSQRPPLAFRRPGQLKIDRFSLLCVLASSWESRNTSVLRDGVVRFHTPLHSSSIYLFLAASDGV